MYCEKYDVYLDNEGKPTETKCSDPNCGYCSKRPDDFVNECKSCNWKVSGGNKCPGYIYKN